MRRNLLHCLLFSNTTTFALAPQINKKKEDPLPRYLHKTDCYFCVSHQLLGEKRVLPHLLEGIGQYLQ